MEFYYCQFPIADCQILNGSADLQIGNWQSEIGNVLYLFENWNRFLAPFCPYFLRSLIRGSRVTRPACLRAGRRSALNSSSARVMPCLIAPAWPAGPPPVTLMTRSNLFVVSVSCKG